MTTTAELRRLLDAPRPDHGMTRPVLRPLDFAARSGNELRPATFAEMTGQARIRGLLERIVANAKATGRPLDSMLLVGSAGTGKTTTGMVIAHELDRPCYMLKAPVAQDVLAELARVAGDGDVVIVDECHLWAKPDRRGVDNAASPEQLYAILEDHRLQTVTGVVPFPTLCWIACTTDVGLLPEPLIARFGLQPHLDPYTVPEMVALASRNARQLGMVLTEDSGEVFAGASRGVPRVVNRYIKNCRSLGAWDIDHDVAVEVVEELNSTTLDGLDASMQGLLRFLLKSRRESRDGTVTYQAGAGTISTALGFSRDQKRLALYVEPYPLSMGLIGVGHGGRYLTDAGIKRAQEL